MEISMELKNGHKTIKIDFLLLAILSVAALLRFYNLGFQEAWLDELSTMQVSDPELSFDETHTLIMTREGFPHLYFLSLKYLTAAVGHSIYVLRFFSAIFGVASVYGIFIFVKAFADKRTAYIATILLTFNFFHIYHSQEARSYILMFFFVVIASYRMVKYIRQTNYINAVYLGIACGLIPNAHPLGVLNILVIYATLGVFLLLENNKMLVFKQLLISGLCSILVFLPVYQMLARVSAISSFWTPPASFENVKQVFFELSGSNTYLFYIYILSILLFLSILGVQVWKYRHSADRIKIYMLALATFWILINFGIIIIKSYTGISILISRYFIGGLPLFILSLSYCIGLIKNNYARNIIIASLVLYSCSFIYEKAYYTTVWKTQWQQLAKEIISNNTANDKIYSAYGFTSNILFKHTPSYSLMKEMKLEDYIRTVRNGTIDPENFWYFDGNQRPFSVSASDQAFLDENYILDRNIVKLDCWARHYILKNQPSTTTDSDDVLLLSSFNPKIIDNNGNLLMFSNGSISTKPLSLEPGDYELILHANSLPAVPIEGINAHIKISLNDTQIAEKYLSEKSENKEMKFTFKISDSTSKVIAITFDNDYAKDDLDRNVVVYFIQLKKLVE